MGGSIHFKAHIFPLNLFGQTFEILERKENETLCWGGDVILGIHAKRCFILMKHEEEGVEKTIYYTLDRFGGKSAPRIWEMNGQKVKEAFIREASNLKEEVERAREPAI